MKSSSLALTLLAAAAMSACGGSSSGNTAAVVTDPSIGVATTYTAYSASGATDQSSITSTKTGTGTATIVAGSQTANITASDAKGNATAVTGSFAKVLAFGGNAAGQLCAVSASGGTGGFKSAYSFVLATAQAATVAELKGKTLKIYEDCTYAQDITFNADGSANASRDGATPASMITAAFSASGNLFTENGKQGVTKVRAYKTTLDGVARYVVIETDRVDTANLNAGGATSVWIEQ